MKYKRRINSGNERILDAVQNIIDFLDNKKNILECTGENAKEVHKFINKCLKGDLK
jgi:hypothetical protein